MKLLIVTCLKENQEETTILFEKAGITIFSITETTGYKAGLMPDLSNSWFAIDKEHYNSVFLFSFTADENAKMVLKLIEDYNHTDKADPEFPIKGFIVPVEQTNI